MLRRMGCEWRVLATSSALAISAACVAGDALPKLDIQTVTQSAKRLVTVDDISRLRSIDSLSVSADGRHFAIFVRQGDPLANTFNTGWFIGETSTGELTAVGGGGDLEPATLPNGQEDGLVSGGESRWSPDGEWIAYTARYADEVQLWRSRVDGSVQEQVTHSAADVRDFAWNEDGSALYFETGEPRAALRAAQIAKERTGYQYDDDLNTFTDFMQSQLRPSATLASSVWAVSLRDRKEGPASEHVRAEYFADASSSPFDEVASNASGNVSFSAPRADGMVAQLVTTERFQHRIRVVAGSTRKRRQSIDCTAPQCKGLIPHIWWSADGKSVRFLRYDGFDTPASGFYTWSPATGKVELVIGSQDDVFRLCAPTANDGAVCVRETPTRPTHLAAIDFRSRSLEVLADLNSEFVNIRLGRVERFEWDLPKYSWNEKGGQLAGLYGTRTYGYIYYPPDFDPSKQYPVFIEPYVAGGFDHPARAEHPLHVYAANGFVVLSMSLPNESEDVIATQGPLFMQRIYSLELDFPLLSMGAESTIRGLDSAATRGFIDRARVGIGGVSHGTFVPLYMMQKHDLIAAISISSPHWGPFQYYWGTKKLRRVIAAASGSQSNEGWLPRPGGAGDEFWRQIDIADHVDAIEAPVLMQLADRETFALLRLIRNMEDAGKPYDAYVFPHEGHIKWQPAHLRAIMTRNLDWFRFWLQGYEDTDPTKAAQYKRWEEMRTQHATAPTNQLQLPSTSLRR